MTIEFRHYLPDRASSYALTDVISASWSRSERKVGSCVLNLPSYYAEHVWDIFDVDSQLEIIDNAPYGSYLDGETIWLLQMVVPQRGDDGSLFVQATYVDLIDLLTRRIVAYDRSTAGGYKSIAADTFCHQVVLENLGSSATTDRQISGLSVQPNRAPSPFPVVEKIIEYELVSDILSGVADASFLDPSTPMYLTYDLIPTSGGACLFTTYDSCRGTDRRSGASSITLSEETMSLRTWQITKDFGPLKNAVYAIGPGESTARSVQTAVSLPSKASLYLRREMKEDASKEITNSGVQSAAYRALTKNRSRIIFEGDADLNRTLSWNKDIGFGDLVNVMALGTRLTCRVDTFKRDWSQESGIATSVRLRAEELV